MFKKFLFLFSILCSHSFCAAEKKLEETEKVPPSREVSKDFVSDREGNKGDLVVSQIKEDKSILTQSEKGFDEVEEIKRDSQLDKFRRSSDKISKHLRPQMPIRPRSSALPKVIRLRPIEK